MKYRIEIATTDFESTKNAVAGDADRIELCANLAEGGTTPSYGLMQHCRAHFNIPIYPIIRVRGGDFFYTDEEFECMKSDALNCKELDCDGVVIGFLKRDGSIDVRRTQEIVDAVYPLKVTFHRAFDRCKDPFRALEQLIEIGCENILTSGQQLTAMEGAALIKALHQQANHRIQIMAGSGVTPENIRELAAKTGTEFFHASLRTAQKSTMKYLPPAFEHSAANEHPTVHEQKVRDLRNALNF